MAEAGVIKWRATIIWAAVLGIVALTAFLVFLARGRPGDTVSVASTARPPEPGSPLPAAPPPTPAPEAVRSATPPAPAAPPGDAGGECRHSDDCRHAKLPDCVVPSCAAGQCRYDRSTCECASDQDCDDHVECTRDLCFARTKKCIHIRSACE